MMTIVLAIVGMMLFALFMSLGLILNNKPIEGTCAAKTRTLFGEGAVCSVCGQVPDGNCDTARKGEVQSVG